MYLLYALERKYPDASHGGYSKMSVLLPSRRGTPGRGGSIRRHHVHTLVLQRVV